MYSVFRTTLVIFVAFATNNVFAISGAYGVGGGDSIPLPPGEWVVQTKKATTLYGKNGETLVLGLAPGQTGNVVGILAKHTKSVERWKSEPMCYRSGQEYQLRNTYGTKPSQLTNKCSGVRKTGTPLRIAKLISNLEREKDPWILEFVEGLKKLPEPEEKVFTVHVELRQFGGRNVILFLLIKPPSSFNGEPLRYESALLKTPFTEWLGEWIELYTESLQASFQFRKAAPRIVALGFDGKASATTVASKKDSNLNSSGALLESARRADSNREDLNADVKITQPNTRPALGTNSAQTVASLDPVKQGKRAEVKMPVEEQKPSSLGAEKLEILRNTDALQALQQAEKKALQQQRQAVEAQAQKQRAAQQRLEQERLALAKQKDSIAADLAAMRLMLAELKRANEESARAEKKEVAASVIKDPLKVTMVARRRALVIGNNTYKNISVLDNAVEDARAMAETLEGLGYKVDLHANLTERAFKRALRAFRADLRGGEEVLFFYAGHGVQLGNSNYLLPIDMGSESAAQVKDESIPLQRVLDDMAEQKTKFALAVIDACRDNPFKQTGRAIGGRGLAPTTAATGQMVMFSAGAGQQALDKLGRTDSSPNGLFTRVFLNEMKKPGIPVDKVLRNVRERVVTLARSVGHEQVPALYDQSIGEFYFKPNR